MAREFSKVGVVGLGSMGAGIAEVFARSGLRVVGIEPSPDALERGRGHLERSTARALARGKLNPEAQEEIVNAITFTTSMDDLRDADLVIEAVPEHRDLKRDVFAALDKVCRPDAVLATNTSSLSVTEISAATTQPERVVGLHFFNPAPVMKFVEIVRTVVTEPQVIDDVQALARRLGKTGVTIGDRAGFVANALLFGYLNHAVSMYEAHHATREDIDAAMTLGCGLPMGPLALLDLIGLDTAHEILDTMYHQSRVRLHAPAPLLRQLVTAGMLGRKTGRGFYTYEAPGSGVVSDAVTPGDSNPNGPTTAADVRTVGVVGSGPLAAGLGELFAGAGYDVVSVTDAQDPSSLNAFAEADLVIDADVAGASTGESSKKQALFAALAEVCRPDVVLATTTSVLPVISCAAASIRPPQVIGLHFCEPVSSTRLVELVRTVSTTPSTMATARAVCDRLGTHVVECGDRAGFIVDALLFPYLNDAVRMLEAHYATTDDIDAAMTLGCGFPLGPFELLDVVGLDAALAIQRAVYAETREPGYSPAPLLEQLVTAGHHGRTAGRGFRDHAAS